MWIRCCLLQLFLILGVKMGSIWTFSLSRYSWLLKVYVFSFGWVRGWLCVYLCQVCVGWEGRRGGYTRPLYSPGIFTSSCG